MFIETRAPNGRLLTFSINEDFPATPGTAEKPFWLHAFLASERPAQSLGIGKLHMPAAIKALAAERPGQAYSGQATEIELSEGLPPTSQPARRARFYAGLNSIPGMEVKKADAPYQLPLFQPENAAAYVPQRSIPGEGPIDAELLFIPMTEGPMSGRDLQSIVRRLYLNGYSVADSDPYIQERLHLIDPNRPSYLIPFGPKSQIHG